MVTKKRLVEKKKGQNEKGSASTKFMDSLRDFVRTRGSEFLRDGNISSIGVGYKIKDGKPTQEVSIQFTVRQKAAPEALESLRTEAIPKSFLIGGIEVPTDVIQRQFSAEYRLVSETAGNDRKKRLDPVVPGISVANVRVSAGTIGSIVYDRSDGTPYILSNWHVLQGSTGVIGDDIVQPGPHDDNRINLNRLGKLVRSHLGQAGDCAIATIEDRGSMPELFELGVVAAKLGEPALGDKVVKSGRTTGVTHGIVTRIHTLTKIDYEGAVGEQDIGGFEIGLDPQKLPDNGEISMGGDSGSVWLFKSSNGKATEVMAGLHFAGEGPTDPNEHAIACYPKSVFEKLEISLAPPTTIVEAVANGFAANFLSVRVDLPKLSSPNRQKAFTAGGSEAIHYTHFSLALNKIRRFAFWVGWNIDGGRLRKLSRKGIPFIFDSRVPKEFQIGDDLYSGNRLDRGHIARRADLLWGGPNEAKKANKDSFFFTNITPQMDDFNQGAKGGLWGQLEDAVFEDADVENLRVSVFGGPVFREDDRDFRGVKLPHEFWKLIAYVDAGELKAKAFLLTQNLDQLEIFELDAFKVYQVAVTEIEARCGITFPSSLRSADAAGERLMRQSEGLRARNPLGSIKDIDWS